MAPETPSSERRFVQNSVNAFIRWMPLGGSGWLFLSFLLKQQWAMTLLMFPVTAVTAVWAAYSKNFIEQLEQIYAERGKSDARKFVSALDSLDEALKWQFSGFEARYLRCQRLDCQEDDPEGVRGDFIPLLQEVFVPLRLTIDPTQPGFGRLSDNERSPISLKALADCQVSSIWDVLRRVEKEPTLRQIVIRAWGGYGKTTLLKHLAYTYGGPEYRRYRAPKLIPFLLYLTRCRGELTKGESPTLPELLTGYHLPRLPQGKDLQPPPNWAENLLKRGRALVMMDGFDEVPQGDRSTISTWISNQMRQYPDSVFIITSRPAAYSHDYTAKRPSASFWVEDFNDEQRQRFVTQWYLCQERFARGGRSTADVTQKAQQKAASLLAQIEARPELQAIAGNALLLNMMARFHRDKQGAELPDRKTKLYQDICELQLERRAEAKGIKLLLSTLTQRQEVLQRVALTMMQRAAVDEEGFKQIHQEELLALMRKPLEDRDPDVEAEAFLKQMVDISELLVKRDVERESGIYEFAHLSFQEFLAASEVVRLRDESLLHDWLTVDAWKPTLLFYADLVNPTRLIREALSRNPSLAYEIWQKTSRRLDLTPTEQRELEALKSTVQASRYRLLEELLKNGEWKKADDETYRLMITTVGKDEGQWFAPEELLNFPCEELLTIDGLWVKYSQGQFGFSVQKQIYVSCGASLDGEYPGDKIWEEFGDRVGWRKDEMWLSYDNLNPDPSSSPQGIFPRAVLGGVRVGGVLGGAFAVGLFSRIETCKL